MLRLLNVDTIEITMTDQNDHLLARRERFNQISCA